MYPSSGEVQVYWRMAKSNLYFSRVIKLASMIQTPHFIWGQLTSPASLLNASLISGIKDLPQISRPILPGCHCTENSDSSVIGLPNTPLVWYIVPFCNCHIQSLIIQNTCSICSDCLSGLSWTLNKPTWEFYKLVPWVESTWIEKDQWPDVPFASEFARFYFVFRALKHDCLYKLCRLTVYGHFKIILKYTIVFRRS